ncbi:MAG: hypothetical protein BGO88_14675 [Flavobacterium sp. 38-13]|uniref:GNAT family N-acetyltransferase n=1 Tax=Flavobacterium sp. 38-13 TaxID=1896168 RepID=UPI0009639754|nr:GNAT family N-acetyltransferase [Flavobacterium sp. 38-13]OJX49483.1 MAG: hypothetical protein BGO88_14675 [Flavobacterium sp. 38-13]
MTKENYNIRFAKKDDVAEIVKLVRTSFNQNYLIPSIYRGKGIEKFVLQELDNPFSPYRYFVLMDEDEIAGYAEYKIFESASMAFLNMISVNNKYKNKGIGRKLFDYTRVFFLEMGLKAIQLDVYETNSIALSWYSGLGFRQSNAVSFFKIKLKQEVNEIQHKLYIQNYPQYKELQNTFGFYFLDLTLAGESIRLGVIEQDLIIRGSYTQALEERLTHFSKILGFENVYFIGTGIQSGTGEFVDKIIRMELNIKL